MKNTFDGYNEHIEESAIDSITLSLRVDQHCKNSRQELTREHLR